MHSNPVYHELALLSLEYITTDTLMRCSFLADDTPHRISYMELQRHKFKIEDQIKGHIKKMGIETSLTNHITRLIYNSNLEKSQ